MEVVHFEGLDLLQNPQQLSGESYFTRSFGFVDLVEVHFLSVEPPEEEHK